MRSTRHHGEQRLLRALIRAAERDLEAAFARRDRRAVRQFEDETLRLRLLLRLAGRPDRLEAAI